MAASALLDAASIGERWRESLATALTGAGGLEDALAAVDGWATQVDDDDEFAGLLYRASFQTHLGGQLMVRDVESIEDEDDGASEPAKREDPFLVLPFEQALEYFRAKNLITEAEFDSLRDRYREGGFIARRLASQRLQEVARSSIERLLSQDLTIEEVIREIRSAERDELALGISPASPAYLETVIRTNVASAYGHGRYEALQDPNVQALRPYVRFVTAADDAVRPTHLALHGKVFRAGSDGASYYAPPIGFRCRCSMVSLSERQFTARAYVLTEGRVPGIEPDSGWGGAPRPLTQTDI